MKALRMQRYKSRKMVNLLALTLSLAAMAFGLVWLIWILWMVFEQGIGALSFDLLVHDTPAPGNVGGLRNAIFGSVIMVTLRSAKTGVITGILLALARISGETAPLLFTALSNQFWSTDLSEPMANLPVTIFKYAMSPFADWQQLAWAGVFIITMGVLFLNILARVVFRQQSANH